MQKYNLLPSISVVILVPNVLCSPGGLGRIVYFTLYQFLRESIRQAQSRVSELGV